MADLPTIPYDYKPFYVQANGEDTEVYDIRSTWGLVVQHNPYPLFPEPKNRYSVDWKDENGIDEFGAQQFLESLDFEVEFWLAKGDSDAVTARQKLRTQFENIRSFFAGGPFRFYDSYTGIGLGQVRMESFSEDKYVTRLGRTDYFFKVRFRCYAPTTRYYYDSVDGIAPYQSQPLPTAYTPFVLDYSPFYFAAKSTGIANDTRQWGMIAKSDPHPVLPDAKDGYVEKYPWLNSTTAPAQSLFFKATEFEVEFYVKTFAASYQGSDFEANELLLSYLWAFRNFITGTRLMTLDSFTDVGYADVQYMGGEIKEFLAREDWARAILSVRFRANDPLTAVSYDNGYLVTKEWGGLNDINSIPLYSSEGFRLRALM